MQKDFHFYLTYALARKVGINAKTAEIIAWADQYTDDLTKPDIHEIQTQSAILGNWKDKQIQLSVLVPFHFIPGDSEHFWMVTRNCSRARALVKIASNPFELGIALHVLQDTFSHENFSGWEERLNACQWFWYISNPTPNIGHADMGVTPDVINYIWTDPRSGKVIDNKKRALAAAKVTYQFLCDFCGSKSPEKWGNIAPRLREIFKLTSYEQRKDELCKLVPVKPYKPLTLEFQNRVKSYKHLTLEFQGRYKKDFITVARQHLSRVIESL